MQFHFSQVLLSFECQLSSCILLTGRMCMLQFMQEFHREELCYGQVVLIRINPAAQDHPDVIKAPLYLTSSMVDMHHFSKVSKNQEVRPRDAHRLCKVAEFI